MQGQRARAGLAREAHRAGADEAHRGRGCSGGINRAAHRTDAEKAVGRNGCRRSAVLQETAVDDEIRR